LNNLVSIDHINLSVKNFQESVKWYKDVFSFEIVEQGLYKGLPWGVLRSQDTMLCIYEEKDKRFAADDDSILNLFYRFYHFGLRIKNKDDWELKVSTLKLKTYYKSPIKYTYSTSWYVHDPSGHEIEVSCWMNNEVKFKNIL
jgi:catechol 2,3-dioxygenase-like lactoylglutathione lyase family enzyme